MAKASLLPYGMSFEQFLIQNKLPLSRDMFATATTASVRYQHLYSIQQCRMAVDRRMSHLDLCTHQHFASSPVRLKIDSREFFAFLF